MANYFTIDYEDTTPPASGTLELNNGAAYSSGLTVNVSMFAGSGFTPTHYKLWGLELVSGEGVVTSGTATWQAFPASGMTTAILDPTDENPQYASVKFKDAGETETDIAQSNGVTFSFVAPIIDDSVEWKQSFASLGYEDATSNTLANTNFSTEVELNKSKLGQLKYSGRDFSGLKVEENAIYINPASDLGHLIGMDNSSYVSASKQFSTSEVRMLTVDYGNGPETLTGYDNSLKTTLSGANLDRVQNVSWNSGTNTLTFDAYKFSYYGFTTIKKVEFTTDSQTAGYTGTTINFYVHVIDTNGEDVENAPVTVSGYGDVIGTITEAMPVNTDAQGRATFTLPITAEGIEYFTASVDGTYDVESDLMIFSLDKPATQRSLLTELEQIYKTETYSDTVSGVNTQAVAEPSGSTDTAPADGVLEHDLNVMRTLLRQVKGTTNWYDDLGNYFDPTDTDESNTESKALNLTNIKNNTLDANTIILAVDESNSGSGFSVSAGEDGFLFSTSLRYATPDNRVGLPIYNSVTNSGSYYDEGGWDRVVGIDLINMSTGSEFTDGSGNIVYAKFHDGADYGGTGDGTDVYVKFYTSAGDYTTASGDPSSMMMVYPYRKTLDQMEEYEWVRTTFVSSWEGDAAIVEDISDLWSYAGSLDGETNPTWTVISGSPIVDTDQTSLVDAINALNDEIGDRTWTLTVSGVLTNGQSITDALDALDMGIYDLEQSVEANVGEIYIEVPVSDIAKNAAHDLPGGLTYTPDNTTGQEGKNMDIFMDGMLLTASTGLNGANRDRDYAEINSSQVQFHFKVNAGSNITYLVRQ